jgi:signal transduction histidine kinase
VSLDRAHRRPRPSRWLPLLVLAAGVAASVALAVHWTGIVEREAQVAFAGASQDGAQAVRAELARSEDALRGLNGLFAASDKVSREEFRRYVRTLELPDRHPSLRGVTFIASVPPAGVAGFAAAQRADGASDFRVRRAPSNVPPAPPAPDRRIVTFTEPAETPGVKLGFEVSRRATARLAQDRSRDTGGTTLTARAKLIDDPAPGFGLYMPVYRGGFPTDTVAQRRLALRGWLQARFRGPDFLAGIQGKVSRDIRIELFDGAEANRALLIGATAAPAAASSRRRTTHVSHDGHTWTVRVTALNGAGGAHREPLIVLCFGLVLSGLLAALVHSQNSARRRADLEVELRTAELRRTAAELRRVNTDLEAHNREVESFARLQRDFVTTASHELRTPLTSVLGYLEIVLGAGPGEISDEQRGHLQVVWRSAQRLLGLVGDLLTVDRAEAGGMDVSPVPIALGPMIAPAVHDLELACVAKGLRLTMGPIPPDLTVVADPDRFRQVLDNLIGNAIKFTPAPGEIMIDVATDGDRARISIADTGPGIPEDELPHIFERFYRTSSTARSAAQGTGLGLSIARALVEAHGGTLSAHSTVGEGTTFTVSVPLAQVPASV